MVAPIELPSCPLAVHKLQHGKDFSLRCAPSEMTLTAPKND